ncbi:MAG: hypothetical protein IAG10_18555 [Planctomycetaceae bacterium]|nr:hypothetical protein [Planctomycetaceae bacterium]
MEYTAEDLIAHKLQRSGILVAKPKFDQAGADLIGLLHVDDGARFCRIQCKGRSLLHSPNSFVDVFADYVSNAFILFLFVETGDSETTNLFAFFGSEIKKKWSQRERDGHQVYRLSITASKLNDEWMPYRFNDSRVESIKQLIRNANVTGEFAHVFTAQAHVTIGAVTCNVNATFTPPHPSE